MSQQPSLAPHTLGRLGAFLSAALATSCAGAGRRPGVAAARPAIYPCSKQAEQLSGQHVSSCWRILRFQQQALSFRGHHTSLRSVPHAASLAAARMRFEWVPATYLLGTSPVHQRVYGFDLTVLHNGFVTLRSDGLGLDTHAQLEFGDQQIDELLEDWFAQFNRISRQTYARHFPLSIADYFPCIFSH